MNDKINISGKDTRNHDHECECETCCYERAKYQTEFEEQHDH